MRGSIGKSVFFVAAIFLASAGCAEAALTISKRPTQNVSCSAGTCAATATKAVLNAADLAAMLADADVSVSSGATAKDIEIDAALNWTSTNRLTLDAYRAIAVNKPIVVAGAGAFTLDTNDGGSGGDFRFFGKGHVEFWDLTSSLIINGDSYLLVKTLKQLRNAVRTNFTHVALARSINAVNKTYDAAPVDDPVQGTFEGLGNSVSHLTIADNTNNCVALFGCRHGTDGVPGMSVRDIAVLDVNITAGRFEQWVGALLGSNRGIVANARASGQIAMPNSSRGSGGGLVGDSGLTIVRSSADVMVSGTGDQLALGGVVGTTHGGCDGVNCSGLVDQSYATGAVTGGDGVAVGGLVGSNDSATISNSYAMGAVTSGSGAEVGGLIGINVDETSEDGKPMVQSSYSTGAVGGGSSASVGGFIGFDVADAANSALYWDVDASGIGDPSQGAGNIPNDPGVTGLTTSALTSSLPSGFTRSIWKHDPAVNGGYPYLVAIPLE